jgi:hypothetical protein
LLFFGGGGAYVIMLILPMQSKLYSPAHFYVQPVIGRLSWGWLEASSNKLGMLLGKIVLVIAMAPLALLQLGFLCLLVILWWWWCLCDNAHLAYAK